MRDRRLHLVVPGPLDQRTGGYLYDARMVSGLRDLGWTVEVHSLEGAFPTGDARAEGSLTRTLAGLPDGARVLLDGLAMGALPGPLQASATRLRLVALVHHPLADETGLGAPERKRLSVLERDALAACMGVMVTSEFTAERLGAWDVPRSLLRVVPPGCDPAPQASGPPTGDPPRLLCVGAVTPRKGYDVLVRALAHVQDLPWSCLFAGSFTYAPAYAETVLQEVERSGLSARITFVGECGREQLDGLYARSSLFVLPSYYEGYGMVLAEALARGLPVVSTTGGAIPYTVPAGVGVLVEPGDATALASELRSLLAEPGGSERRSTLAAAARRYGVTLPSWEAAGGLFAKALLELTADWPPCHEQHYA